MKRPEEEYCKRQFDTFVRKFFDLSGLIWEKVAQKDEPPDYYLLLGNERFAVEVTTLVEKIPIGGPLSLPPKVINKILQKFAKSTEALARAEGNLHGSYVISFYPPIENFADVREEIQEGAFDYIRDTSNLETSPCKVIFKSKTVTPRQMSVKCGIQKVDGKPDKISCGVSGGAKWEGEVREGLCSLLNQALDGKVHKLRKIAASKILLLFDEYIFADLEDYKTCISQIPSLSSFHTVFVVQDQRNRFLLYSQHSDWSTQQFIVTATN